MVLSASTRPKPGRGKPRRRKRFGRVKGEKALKQVQWDRQLTDRDGSTPPISPLTGTDSYLNPTLARDGEDPGEDEETEDPFVLLVSKHDVRHFCFLPTPSLSNNRGTMIKKNSLPESDNGFDHTSPR